MVDYRASENVTPDRVKCNAEYGYYRTEALPTLVSTCALERGVAQAI